MPDQLRICRTSLVRFDPLVSTAMFFRPKHQMVDCLDVVDDSLNLLAAIGNIKPHTDPDFDRWAYLLILRAGNQSILKTHNHEDVVLTAGMLVEFDAHARHSLMQTNNTDLLVWLPMDLPTRVSFDSVIKTMERNIPKIQMAA